MSELMFFICLGTHCGIHDMPWSNLQMLTSLNSAEPGLHCRDEFGLVLDIFPPQHRHS